MYERQIMSEVKNEQLKQGFHIVGEFDRVRAVEIRKKDGTSFVKHEVHLLVRGKNLTATYPISIKHPEKWQNKRRGEVVEAEIYLSARAYNGQAYVSYYAIED